MTWHFWVGIALGALVVMVIGLRVIGAARWAREVRAHISVLESGITAAAIGGQGLDLTTFTPATEGKLNFHASALAADGFTLDLTVVGKAPVRISLADMSDGLPGPVAARPANTMPTPGATRDGTVVRGLLTF